MDDRDKPIGIGARPKGPKGPNPRNDPFRVGQARNQQQQQQEQNPRPANPSMAKQITWPFHSEEAAGRNLIEQRLELSPVGIIIDVDDEFDALREGFYKIRVVPPDCNSDVTKHALMIMGRGRTEDGQDFFIAQNSWKLSWGVNGYGRLIIDDDTRCGAFYPLL